ncbi:MAG TPA: TetR family transcriptional regulator [Rhizomicrobium sp.]|jgi:AcrR family transcriptional regulator|nr:TetR family transcriptional regulator [Rhizomicrobium sp.]
MSETGNNRARRRAEEHNATRASILNAARRVGVRDGARALSLRGVAAEAGYAPAALYGYFRNKDELLLALAAEDLAAVSRAMRDAAGNAGSKGRLGAAVAAALALLDRTETIAAAPSALSSGDAPDAARLFNGRLIVALKTLSDATGNPADSREAQGDVVLIASALIGLAVLSRTGRLSALGFAQDEILARLDARFSR